MKKYTYEEAYKNLNISRTNFFSRLNLVRAKIENHITKQDGINYIDQQGFDLLQNYKKINTEKNDEKEKQFQLLQDQLKKITEENISYQEKLKEKAYQHSLIEEQLKDKFQNNSFLQEQLREKDQQIKTLTTLVENGQILLKQEQEQCKLLAESVQTVHDEVVQIPQTVQSKGLWQKIFRT